MADVGSELLSVPFLPAKAAIKLPYRIDLTDLYGVSPDLIVCTSLGSHSLFK